MKMATVFALPAGLSSLTVLILGLWSVVGTYAQDYYGNVLRGNGELPKRKPELPKRRPRIINGEDVLEYRYPYYSLMLGEGLCGGVLIAPRLVLSAAHCKNADDQFRVGAFEDMNDGHHVSIRSAVMHPEYDRSRFDHDIMIFQLDDDADHPYITLEREEIDEGYFTVLGFGDTNKGAPLELSPRLQEVELEYVDNETCDDGHGGNGEVLEDMMCVAGDDKDSCIGKLITVHVLYP